MAKIKKAQAGKTQRKTSNVTPVMAGPYGFNKKKLAEKSKNIENKYKAGTTPKMEYDIPLRKTPGGLMGGQSVSIDTSGLSTGAKRFPTKTTMRSGNDMYYEVNRRTAKQAAKSLQNQKHGGTTHKKMQAGGVAGKSPKAGMVDPKGAYTKVQQRNLPPASMKKRGKVSMMKKMSKKK